MKRTISSLILCLVPAFLAIAQNPEKPSATTGPTVGGEFTTLKTLIEDSDRGAFRIMATFTEVRDSLNLVIAVEDGDYVVPVRLAGGVPDAEKGFLEPALGRGDTLVIEGTLGPVFISGDNYKGLTDAVIIERREAAPDEYAGFGDGDPKGGSLPYPDDFRRPTFKGGNPNDFSEWVNNRLVYPSSARLKRIQGCVQLQFTIAPDGSVTDVRVESSVDPALDAEAVRVVSRSPKWEPATLNGEPVSSTFHFPVFFLLRKPQVN